MSPYLVARAVGGIMEMPYFSYENYEVIIAPCPEIAVQIYNDKYHCEFFYGTCIGEVKDNDTVTVPVKFFLNQNPCGGF